VNPRKADGLFRDACADMMRKRKTAEEILARPNVNPRSPARELLDRRMALTDRIVGAADAWRAGEITSAQLGELAAGIAIDATEVST